MNAEKEAPGVKLGGGGLVSWQKNNGYQSNSLLSAWWESLGGSGWLSHTIECAEPLVDHQPSASFPDAQHLSTPCPQQDWGGPAVFLSRGHLAGANGIMEETKKPGSFLKPVSFLGL